jgi:basic membrane protein A
MRTTLERLMTCWVLVLLVVGVSPAGCSDDEGNGKKQFKVAWVYIGPPGDLGWTYAHDQGRKLAEAAVNKEQTDYEVVTSYKENVPEDTAQAKAAIEELVKAGNDLVFTTSWGYADPTLEVAKAHPDVLFEHCSGIITHTNMASYFGRMYQARFLTGLVAGAMTKNNKIGFVAAFPISEVIRGINAFARGARIANPAAEVHVKFTDTWYDVVKEGQVAKDLLETDGVDVIAQHQDSTAAVVQAQDHGAYAIGYDSDMLPYASDTVLTSAIWHWEVYYEERILAALDETWTAKKVWEQMSTGIVGLGTYGAMVPQTVKDDVSTYEQKITSGEWDVFWGEVKKQDGTVWVADGQKMTDDEIWDQMEFVEGVVGTIPP